jgi:ribosomal protein L23
MSILIKPIITEKATADAELNNRYGFIVNPKANKVEIKKAVEAAYEVSVLKVRTLMSARIDQLVSQKREFKLVKQMLIKKQLYRWRKVIQ